MSFPAPPARDVAANDTAPAAPPLPALPALLPIHLLLSHDDDGIALPGHTLCETVALTRVARWSRDFLTNPHPTLGRAGQVCPYVSASIRDQLFLLTLIREAETRTREAEEILLRLCKHFLELEPRTGRPAQRKTIVVLFRDLPPHETSEIINELHQRLKPHFLRRGLMLGEFYAESHKPGLHNPDFRPLRSDTPLLVIRSMVLTDIAFLSDDGRFVRAYLDTFGSRGCAEVRDYVEREGGRLSAEQIELLLEQVEGAEALQSSVRRRCPHEMGLAADAPLRRDTRQPAR